MGLGPPTQLSLLAPWSLLPTVDPKHLHLRLGGEAGGRLADLGSMGHLSPPCPSSPELTLRPPHPTPGCTISCSCL